MINFRVTESVYKQYCRSYAVKCYIRNSCALRVNNLINNAKIHNRQCHIDVCSAKVNKFRSQTSKHIHNF
jgi:hypothetical protein